MGSTVRADIRPLADGSVAVWTQNAKTCAECGQQHFFFISRDGHTVCVWCDEKAAMTGVRG